MFQVNFIEIGQVGVAPRTVKIFSSDTFATITAAGWLQQSQLSPNQMLPTDIVEVVYNVSGSNPAGTFGVFLPSFSSVNQITLVPYSGYGNVTYVPTSTAGQIPVWSATDGQLANSGVTPAPFVGGATAGWAAISQTGPLVVKNILSSVFAGGSVTFTPTVTGLTSAWFAYGQIYASTNSVSVNKCVAGTNNVTITFSADPGAATTVQLLLVSAAG